MKWKLLTDSIITALGLKTILWDFPVQTYRTIKANDTHLLLWRIKKIQSLYWLTWTYEKVEWTWVQGTKEKEHCKIFWGLNMQCDQVIEARWLESSLINKDEVKKIDGAMRGDSRVKWKEKEKIEKTSHRGTIEKSYGSWGKWWWYCTGGNCNIRSSFQGLGKTLRLLELLSGSKQSRRQHCWVRLTF